LYSTSSTVFGAASPITIIIETGTPLLFFISLLANCRPISIASFYQPPLTLSSSLRNPERLLGFDVHSGDA